jgi:hypothetical protein
MSKPSMITIRSCYAPIGLSPLLIDPLQWGADGLSSKKSFFQKLAGSDTLSDSRAARGGRQQAAAEGAQE